MFYIDLSENVTLRKSPVAVKLLALLQSADVSSTCIFFLGTTRRSESTVTHYKTDDGRMNDLTLMLQKKEQMV
jgi:hypothetical protein